MSYITLIESLQQGVTGGASKLSVLNDGSLGNTLNYGQILKGRVLRHYEGSSYVVEFGGKDVIVDSAIPLNSNEILYGRVVGIDEKVHLKRLPNAADKVDTHVVNDQSSLPLPKNTSEALLQTIQSKFNVVFNKGDSKILLQAMRTSGDSVVIALSGVILKKLGVSLNPEALLAVNKTLKNEIKISENDVEFELPNLGANKLAADEIDKLIRDVAQVAQNQLQRESNLELTTLDDVRKRQSDSKFKQQSESGDYGQRDSQQNLWMLGKYLLNGQQDGTVAHKYTTIPMWVGDKCVEIDLTMLSQRKNNKQGNGIRHQHLAFSLDLENLGRVEMNATVSDRYVSLKIATESEQKAEIMSGELISLRDTLERHQWILDSVHYQAITPGGMNAALKTVMEHHVTQDSLNQLY